MQEIVIKIPEDMYNCLNEMDEGYMYIIDVIKNGVVLPKGHGRLIDVDEIQFENTEFDTYGDYCIAFDAIDQANTVLEADKEIVDAGNSN